LAALLICSGGCDDRSTDDQATPSSGSESEERERAEALVWEPDGSVDLREPPSEKRREVELTEPKTYPTCRKLLEEEGEPRPQFLPDRESPDRVLAGCRPEGSAREDGRRFVAYKVPYGDGEAGDLRLVAYGADGTLQWSGRMDRSEHTDHFRAVHRSSFVALLLPQLACAGTLWEGGTQVACFDAETGEVEWKGELKFWSGIPLQAVGRGLHGADISGLTRRYPYSGAEMRRVDFDHTGGHSALYLTDGRRLYYAPNNKPPVHLVAYDFASLEPVWRSELPGHPDAGYGHHVFAGHQLGVLKIGGRVFGFDTGSGELRWSLRVGDDRPPMAASEDRLYVLLRRSDASTRLFALEPKSGELVWWSPMPTGTLQVEWVDGALRVRSVKAVQVVIRG